MINDYFSITIFIRQILAVQIFIRTLCYTGFVDTCRVNTLIIMVRNIFTSFICYYALA